MSAPTATPTAASMAGQQGAQASMAMQNLTPDQQAALQANMLNAVRQNNAAYLQAAINKTAICPPAAGGTTQPFATSSSLLFNFPKAAGAYAKTLLITLNLAVTPATGTAAAYAMTAAGIYALISEIDINVNGSQARIWPYILKVLEKARSRQNPDPGAVPSNANSIASVTTALNSGTPLVVNSANTWNLVIRIPLNVLHELSPIGMIPIQGSGTQPQVSIQTAAAVMGPDPRLNAIYANGGTGNAVTVTGTVKCECIYTDGTNYNMPTPLSLQMSGQPTAQYLFEQPLTGLTAGLVNRQRIATLLQHYYVISIIIDGNQSNKFAAASNIVNLELDQDSVGQNKFWVYGNQSNNVSVNDYFEMIRHIFQQDFDEGVIPWIMAESYGQENPDNRMGNQALNMTPGGWTDVNHGYTLTAVNGLGTVAPRVETYIISLNPTGLVQ